MRSAVMTWLASTLGFIVLDGVWLGLVMTPFYTRQLAPIARMADGALAPWWAVALWVYPLLGAGVAWFALPRATDLGSAALSGAGLGLVVYGVYDLTNLSTLAAWPVAVTVADIVWGIVATAAVSAAVYAWHTA